MKDITKYQGVIPAFYACYDAEGNISTEGVKALTRHLIAKGVKGVYVGGSSGECIYQHVDERKAVLEAVMSEAKGKLTVIAHVGCNNTADSVELARHAESVGVDAIASIPPIYFHLPEYAIAKYWNEMSAAAPNTEFVIYNIPQLAMNEHVNKGEIEAARAIQYDADRIIYKMCEAHGNLYAVQKEILRRMYGLELGGVREPMPGLIPEDEPIVAEAQAMIEAAIAKL